MPHDGWTELKILTMFLFLAYDDSNHPSNSSKLMDLCSQQMTSIHVILKTEWFLEELTGQDPSGFHLCPELTLCHSFPYPGPSGSELVSQACWHNWEHRWDHDFCLNSWLKRDTPRAIRTQKPRKIWGQDPVSFFALELTLGHSSPYPNSSMREQVSKKCWHTDL